MTEDRYMFSYVFRIDLICLLTNPGTPFAVSEHHIKKTHENNCITIL